jgi:hypothetical protein
MTVEDDRDNDNSPLEEQIFGVILLFLCDNFVFNSALRFEL